MRQIIKTKKDITSMRAFIAIDVEMNDKIKEIYDTLKKTNAKLKFVEPQNIHLTIKFLGEIDEKMVEKIKEDMKEATKEIKPFKAILKGLGVFPNERHIRVIWIGFNDNGETVAISKNIDERLCKYGFKKEKDFKPHVTIARMKSIEAKDKVIQVIKENKEKEFGEVDCNTIKLKQSILRPEGPIYKTIYECKL